MLALCTLPIMQRRSRAEVTPSLSPVRHEEEARRPPESDGDDSSVGHERSWRRRGKTRYSRSRSEEGPTVSSPYTWSRLCSMSPRLKPKNSSPCSWPQLTQAQWQIHRPYDVASRGITTMSTLDRYCSVIASHSFLVVTAMWFGAYCPWSER
jgi:hypothetical protein